MLLERLATDLDLTPLPDLSASASSSHPIEVVLEIVFGLLGSISLLIIILAGIKYITSQGEPDKVARAKDTIIYAAIGLAVSLSAYGIVTFVIKNL